MELSIESIRGLITRGNTIQIGPPTLADQLDHLRFA
jgi:hypothetical protein